MWTEIIFLAFCMLWIQPVFLKTRNFPFKFSRLGRGGTAAVAAVEGGGGGRWGTNRTLVSDMSLKSFYDSLKKISVLRLEHKWGARFSSAFLLQRSFNLFTFFYFQFYLSVCFGISPPPPPQTHCFILYARCSLSCEYSAIVKDSCISCLF